METKILLLRHGQSVANIGKYFSGQTDVELTELGRRQAELAAESLADLHIDVIYSSPLKRARETALPFAMARGLDIRVEDDLIEWDAGYWEGMHFPEIIKSFPESYHNWSHDLDRFKMPNGESSHEVRDRFGKALDRIAQGNEGKVILIACHGGVIMTTPSYYSGRSAAVLNSTPVPGNCSITEIVYTNGSGRVSKYSDQEHLGKLKSEIFLI